MTPTIEELAEKWDIDESLPTDPTDRLKAHVMLLAAEIAIKRDTIHSPPPCIPGHGDGFAEHMACVLSERWSLMADDYVGGIVEGRYHLTTTHDGFLGTYTVKVRPRVFGGYGHEDIREIEGEGIACNLYQALTNLILSLESKLDQGALGLTGT
jgi:hypothetical protein